jgi:serine phosphatase RsbU (regulator of sigma subunit)
MSLASAGHPPAIHANGAGVAQLGGGAVLGAWADSDVGCHEIAIAAGETLVLFTDGWMEVGPVDAHRGPDDLAELVRSGAKLDLATLTESLRADAVERGGGVLRDDMVVLAARPTA